MTEMTPDTKAKLARQFMEAIPHSRRLGMSLDVLADGIAEVSMPSW